MRIELNDIAKKYHRSYIFKDISFTFKAGGSYAILGGNGSGKSTLLSIISGFTSPTKGEVKWIDSENNVLELKNYHQFYTFTAPYLELFEELTLLEHLKYHFQLKKILPGYTIESVMEIAGFEQHKDKQLKNFSSGMLQRLKLCLALFAEAEVLLLDEPCTNMDKDGIAWYQKLVKEHLGKRLIIVASNQPEEYNFCEEQFSLL